MMITKNAKTDFAKRSNLVKESKIFNEKELLQICRCTEDTLNNGYELSDEQRGTLENVRTKIKESVTDFGEKPTAQLFVNEINYEELKGLENQFVDPDVLNFLAQKMDSFDKSELKKFEAVVRTFNIDNPREFVNLTFNMHYYTLIEDMSDMEKVGKIHMLTRNQALSADNSEGYDFYNIGQKLMESETGRLTQYGIIFVNDDLPYEKPYVGNNLPNFEYDPKKLLTLKLQYADNAAYVHLPDSPFAIARAVGRIGADSLDNCEVCIERLQSGIESYKGVFENILKNESVYELNNLSSELDKLYDWKLEKLRAVIEYAEVSDSESIGKLAKNIDKFIHYDDVYNDDELARTWIAIYVR